MKNERNFSFGKRAEKYDKGFEGKFSQKFYTALLSQIKSKPTAKALDVGCGTGYLLRMMTNVYGINGFGIDVERKMIEVAKKQCPEMNIQLSACEKTPFDDNTFDFMTACMAYHHFADKKGFAQEAARVLKTGGYLYIADPRFPIIIRKPLNHFLRLLRVSGKFLTVKEIGDCFMEYGFQRSSSFEKGYVQVIELKKVI